MQNSEWMESVQLITGEWLEGSSDLTTSNLQLSRLFTTVERSNRRLAEGWQFNPPGLIEQEMPRQKFDHPLKDKVELIYDEQRRLIKMSTLNPYPYESIEIVYGENSCTATNHLGDSVVYTIEGKPSRLTKVEKTGAPAVHYKYKQHPTERKQLLLERTVEGVETLLFKYTAEGKLQSVYRNSEEQLLFSLEYFQGKTKASFPAGVVQYYFFNPFKEITKIETWVPSDQALALYRTQSFEWKNHQLITKSTLGVSGNLLIQETYSHDASGRLIREGLSGILTSLNANVSETYTKEYRYGDQGLLVEEIEGNGKITKHTNNTQTSLYDRNTLLEQTNYTYNAAGKIELEESTLYPSMHYQYDPLGNLVEKSCGKIHPATLALEIDHRERFGYDKNNRLICKQVYDASAALVEESHFEYGLHGKCTKNQNNDTTTRFEYGINGLLLSKTEESPERKVTTHYRADGKLAYEEILEAHALSKSTLYIYDEYQKLVKKVDQNGAETEWMYDCLGRKIEEISPEVVDANGRPYRPKTHYGYDELDRLTSLTDAAGFTTSTQYNARGQPLIVLHPDGTKETFEYTLDGRIAKSVNREGIATAQIRDLFDQLLSEIKYDRSGQIISHSEYTYAGLQLIQETHSFGGNKTYDYDFKGRKVAERNIESSLETHYEYNIQGEVTQKKQGWEGHWVIEEGKALTDIQGNILLEKNEDHRTEPPLQESVCWYGLKTQALQKEWADASGISTKCVYDSLGRIVLEEKTSSQGILWSKKELYYDAVGHLAKEILTKKSAAEPLETLWQWGPCGRLEKVIEKHGAITQEETSYFYDQWGQLEKIVKPDGSRILQTFNSQGLLETIRSTDHSINYALHYDAHGLLTHVENLCLATETHRDYYRDGSLLSEILDNGSKVSYEYDDLGRKTRLILPDNSSIAYHYDLAFLKEVQRFDSEGQLQYTHSYLEYDKEGRPIAQQMIGNLGTILDSEKSRSSPFFRETIDYDPQQRIVRKERIDNEKLSTSHYLYNPLSELEEERGTSAVEFDLNGNLIRKWSGSHCYQYKYDALNRMTQCSIDGTVVEEHQYDAYHRRTVSFSSGKKLTYFYDGNCEIG
ncbi:MAG: hypothetical protein ACK5MA_00235, partial [Parachlamydiaceae bacterium]